MRIPTQIAEADFDELVGIIKIESDNLITEAQKCTFVEQNSEIQRLLAEENLERFRAITAALEYPLRGFDYELLKIVGELDKAEVKGRLMQCWITLGSSVETALQIFLAIYLNNYKSSGWGQWDEFNYEEVKTRLLDTITQLKVDSHIDDTNAKSLKKAIKAHLKDKQEVTKLENLNLQSLIAFFGVHVELGTELIDALNVIKANRNVVHAFKQRDVSEWEELIQSLQIYCLVLCELQNRMPPFDDLIELKNEIEAQYAPNYSDYM